MKLNNGINKVKKDISNIESTITWTLTHKPLNELFEDTTRSLNEKKEVIVSWVCETKDTAGRKKMINKINTSKNENDLMFYIYNSIMSGTGNNVI